MLRDVTKNIKFNFEKKSFKVIEPLKVLLKI